MAEATLAQELQNLIPIPQVIFQYDLVVSLVVVVAVVEDVHLLEALFVPLDVFGGSRLGKDMTLNLSLAVLPKVVDVLVELLNFLSFIFIK